MTLNKQIPHDKALDSSLAFIKEGYLFIKNRVDHFQSDLFVARFFGKQVICMSGKDAAMVFYDTEKFQRRGSVPKWIQKSFLGVKSVQLLDGKTHLDRKKNLLSIITPSDEKQIGEMVMQHWQALVSEDKQNIVLFEEAKILLCRVACEWAGVPMKESEVKGRAEDFISIIDSFGAIGPRNWKGRKARQRVENWLSAMIEDIRSSRVTVREDSPLYRIITTKNINGQSFSNKTAAVHLISILKSIVAISIFVTFAALALHKNPDCIPKLKTKDPLFLDWFTQEVRRFYPFAPLTGAKAKKDFTWNNYHFKEGMLVLLDLYGTNQDERIWKNPDQFIPERFKDWEANLFDFIPQGGGELATGHRCPGEGITVEVIKASVDFLVNCVEYDVPKQDLSYSLARMPLIPKSGFVISDVKNKYIVH
ncbi:cytochrome P450 [Peribacillus muralis]|uniref:cytochrome P450 n=1 Tax=Peribacillus muralis TaxID=264697 RepID=UPI0036718761